MPMKEKKRGHVHSTKKKRERLCEYCKQPYNYKHSKQRFGSLSCAGKQSNKIHIAREITEQEKNELRQIMFEYHRTHPRKESTKKLNCIASAKYTRGKFKNPQSTLELSKRTISKIFRRMGIGCCVCDWKEEICDIRHIDGRKKTR